MVPFTLLKISNTFRILETGDILEIILSDSDALDDLSRIIPETSYKQVLKVDLSGEDQGTRIQLKKISASASCVRSHQPINKENIMSDLNSIETANTVDARGSACPGPLLEAKKGIGKVKVGQILEIYSNDSGTRRDIPAWSGKVGHEYLGVLEADGYDRHFVRRNK